MPTTYATLGEAMRAEGIEDPDPVIMTNQGKVIVIADHGVVWSFSSSLGGFALWRDAPVATPSTLGAALVATPSTLGDAPVATPSTLGAALVA